MSDEFDIKVEGLDDAVDYIQGIARRVAAGFGEEFGEALEEGRRIAVGASPIVTGSYADSHRVAIDSDLAKLGIDPMARNSASGILVSDYAGAVEKRHHVYARVEQAIPRMATFAVGLSMRQIK